MKIRDGLFLSLSILLLFCVLPGMAEQKIKIVTTTSDLASLAKEVGKDRVEVDSLSQGTRDPHFIEVRPSMVMKLKDADLVILVGMELDIWVQSLIDASRNSQIRYGESGYLDASVGIEKLEVPFGKIDASMGDVHPYGNPHYWLDPENAKIIASNIARRLSILAPAEKECFQTNLNEFNKKIEEKISFWRKKLFPLKGKEIITYHRSWPYFARRFGITIACEIEPKPGIPPSPAHLADVINKVKDEGIQVILMEVFYDEKPAKFISAETGAKVVMVPNSVGGVKEASDYFSLMDIIVERLAKALI